MSDTETAEDRRLKRKIYRKKQQKNAGKDKLAVKLDKEFQSRLRKIRKRQGELHEDDPESGVVYVGHIPFGFFELQMKKFFSQFGRIKRIRMSRNKVTGHCKGYAFIEFEFEDVAKIVADTMNNHLMFRKLLQCKFVPKAKLHAETFKGCFNIFKKQRRRLHLSQKAHNSLLNADEERRKSASKSRNKRLKKKQKKLDELKIDFKIDDKIKQNYGM